MVIDQLVKAICQKQNPCIVGIDPEWSKLPECYRVQPKPEAVLQWAKDVIDAVADIVPAVKPQMAFFEVLGWEGLRVHQQVVRYAHEKGLLVIDDSKRNDIGNTAKAYAYAHLAKGGPINADFMTVSPFLGTDSLQPFLDTAAAEGKGVFVLVKTSNPSSVEISEAVNPHGETIRDWLASYVNTQGQRVVGTSGYAAIGAVVGATYPKEAQQLRKLMPRQFFLVPGFGAQGGGVEDVIPCFNPDGLGAVISSSRGILYHHLAVDGFDHTREAYRAIVRQQAQDMQRAVYRALKGAYPEMVY